MSQTFTTAQTIRIDGQYRVRAFRRMDTDMLSVYVNRVKKISSDGDEATGTLTLEVGDVVESTGELTLEGVV